MARRSLHKADEVQCRQLADAGRPVLLRACYRGQTFSRHAHEAFALGVVEDGALRFHYRGAGEVAAPGAVNLAFPGEVHDGRGDSPEGWTYRMFYLDVAHVLAMAQGLDPTCRSVPFLPQGVLWDGELAQRVARVHRLCESGGGDALTRESLLGALVQELLRKCGSKPPPRPTCLDRTLLLKARQHLEEAHALPVALDDLARLTGLNPYRLLRGFTRAFGLPPHACLVQIRLRRAAGLIRGGMPLARVAQEVGFSDQSHLNRHFVRTFGMPPGLYRQAFR